MKIKRLITSKSFFTFLAQGMGIAFGYISIYLINYYFGSKVLGVYSIFIGILNVLVLIATFGTTISIVKFIGKVANKNDKGFIKEIYNKSINIILITSIVTSIVLFILSDIISYELFQKESLNLPIKIAAVIIPFYSILSLNSGFYRSIGEAAKSILYNKTLLYFFIILLIFVIAATSFSNVNTPIYIHAIVITGLALTSFIEIKKKTSLAYSNTNQEKVNNDRISYKQIINTSTPILVSSSINILNNWITIFILGVFLTESSVGIYNIAFKISAILNILILVFNTIAGPKFSEYYWNKKYNQLGEYIQRNAKYIFFISTPIIIGILIVSSFLLSIFGEEYSLARVPLLILLIGQMISISCGQVGLFMNMTGHEKYFRNILFIAFLINVSLNFILVPKLGLIGASISNTVSLLFWKITSIIIVFNKLGLWAGYPVIFKNKGKFI